MKKKGILVAALLLGTTMTFAQDDSSPSSFEQIENKNGRAILPVAGDIAIQFDGAPLVNFGLNAVNIMSNTGDDAQHPGSAFMGTNTLVGKYFLEDTKAVRVKFAWMTNGGSAFATDLNVGDDPVAKQTAIVAGTHTIASEYDQVEIEKMKSKSHNVTLGGGLEMRRGYGRLQGFYGGELLINKSGSKRSNEYFIEYSKGNEVLRDLGIDSLGSITGASERELSYKKSAFGIAVRGFVGVEYFFLPKMSIGAELGWGLGYGVSGKTETVTEHWDAPDATATTHSQREETVVDGSRDKGMYFNNDGGGSIFGGSGTLNLTCHF